MKLSSTAQRMLPLFVSFSFAHVCLAAEPPTVQSLFQIDGKSVSDKDLTPADQNRLYEIELSRYNTIEGLARQRYVETKTAPFLKLNTKEQPFAAEEKWLAKKFAPEKSEIDRALADFKDEKQLQQIPEAERSKVIERYLASRNRAQLLTEATDKAISKGDLRILVRAPAAPVVEISKSPQPVIGKPESPIRVVEFTDFQCPFCKKFAEVAGEILNKHGSSLVWEVRHFPLGFHKQARDAAAAVYCASLQGKLVEAKKWVFGAQERLAESEIYTQMSQALALNETQFTKCRSDSATRAAIDADVREGERIGVSGTPSVFVNGRKFQGDPHSREAWDTLIRELLAKSSAAHSL